MKIILLFLLSLFTLLAGCGQNTPNTSLVDKQKGNNTFNKGKNNNLKQTEQINNKESDTITKNNIIENQEILQEALNKMDKGLCEKIKDEVLKGQCENQIKK